VEGDKTHDGDPGPTLGVGTKVYVRSRFLGDWATGFAVADVLVDGYRMRRLSDGHAFPDVFSFDDVRQERRQQQLRNITGSHLDRHHQRRPDEEQQVGIPHPDGDSTQTYEHRHRSASTRRRERRDP